MVYNAIKNVKIPKKTKFIEDVVVYNGVKRIQVYGIYSCGA